MEIAACAAALLLMLLWGCGKEDRPTDAGEDGPRIPARLTLDTLITIPSSPAVARDADRIIERQLGEGAKSEIAVANLLLDAYREIPWPDPDGQCWDFILTLGQLDMTYKACLSGSGYVWTLRMNGQSEDGPYFNNWVASRIETSADEQRGTAKQYLLNESTEGYRLAFRRYAQGRAGQWAMLSGAVEPRDSILVPELPDRSDSLVFWRAIPKGLRTEIRADSARVGGKMVLDEWSVTRARWWRRYFIEWKRDGSGTLREYNASEVMIRSETWPTP